MAFKAFQVMLLLIFRVLFTTVQNVRRY